MKLWSGMNNIMYTYVKSIEDEVSLSFDTEFILTSVTTSYTSNFPALHYMYFEADLANQRLTISTFGYLQDSIQHGQTSFSVPSYQ